MRPTVDRSGTRPDLMKHSARDRITRKPGNMQRPPAQSAMTRAGASSPRRWDALVVPAAFVLLAVLAWQVLAFILASSRTSDESAHIMAGYSYLTRRDFRLNPEHPPLIKELAAVPLLFLNLRFPEGKDWDQGDQWNTGQRFIHEQRELVREQLGRDGPFLSADWILTSARLPILALSLVLGWFLFRWSREMFGPFAALLTLALYALDPNIVAHSGLVTTDIGVTLFMFLSVYAFWKYIERPHPVRIVWLGLMIGAAMASKFTALWLLPVLGLLALFHVFTAVPIPARPWLPESETASSRWRRLISIAAVFCAALAISLLVLLACYFVIRFPSYMEGLREGMRHSRDGHPSFLLGQYSQHGWWYYFLAAFGVKSPPGTLTLRALAAAFVVPLTIAGARQERIARSVFLLVPIAVIVVITAGWGVNIGLRHALPAFPFIYLFAGALLRPVRSAARLSKALVIPALLCVAWNAVEAVRISPYDLAYFNPFAGGPERGPQYLSDSNIDWGQSAGALRRYVDRAGVPAIYCAFAGNVDPWDYGVRYQYVPGAKNTPTSQRRGFLVPRNAPREFLAVSVMVAQGLYLSDVKAYDWLKYRTPIDRVGYSLLIYDITRDDMAHVRIAYGCFGYKLYDLAAHEARRALEINPANEYATRLLATLSALPSPRSP